MNKNIYIKDGRKYIPIGVALPNQDYLTDGIWIVKSKPNVKQKVRADYLADAYGLIKCGELSKIDLSALADTEEYAQVIADVLTNLPTKPLSYMEIGRMIMKRLIEARDEKE